MSPRSDKGRRVGQKFQALHPFEKVRLPIVGVFAEEPGRRRDGASAALKHAVQAFDQGAAFSALKVARPQDFQGGFGVAAGWLWQSHVTLKS